MDEVEKSSAPDQFDRLLERLQGGDNDAARAVVEQFRDRLLALAGRQFDGWLRDRADPEGVVQSALLSFFQRARSGHLAPDGWDEMAAVLAVITMRKCSNRRRFLTAGKRDAAREQLPDPDGTGTWAGAAAAAPPDEEAAAREVYEGLVRGFEGREREIVEMALLGCTPTEIADKLNRPVRGVRRILDRIRDRAARLRRDEGF